MKRASNRSTRTEIILYEKSLHPYLNHIKKINKMHEALKQNV